VHLISVLASGVKGAESGTAEIYRRDTSSRATYYTDYIGSNAVSTGTDVQLDVNGGATVYVNESVDIDVKASSGARVRFFTDMTSSPLVEYVGPSFTGVDYDTGATGANKPVSLQTILDRWKTSAGADDFEVLFNSAATGLATALGTLSSFQVFNVTSPAYGAVGNGTTDDTTSIALAITAAAAVDGTIYFPPGTFRITSALQLPGNVNLLGSPFGTSILLLDHATENLIETVAPAMTLGRQEIRYLRFSSNIISTAGQYIWVATATKLSVVDCYFDGDKLEALGASCITGRPTFAYDIGVEGCYFKIGDSGNNLGITSASTSGSLTVTKCDFVFPVTIGAGTIAYALWTDGTAIISACKFDATALTASVATTIIYVDIDDANNESEVTVSGCYFSSCAAALVSVYAFNSNNTVTRGSNGFASSGNIMLCIPAVSMSETLSAYLATICNYSCDRNNGYKYEAINTDVSLASDCYGIFFVVRTSNAAQAVSISAAYGIPGARVIIAIYQTVAAVSGSITLPTISGATSPFTININEVRLIEAVCLQHSTTALGWYLLSEATIVHP